MSYDLEIGTHREPTPEQVEAWAAEHGLSVETDGDELLVGEYIGVGGPYAAEPEDFAEEVAAACLAPRWLMTIAVPYSVPKRNIALGRSLARHLAEAGDGAAFDPQKDALVWPRGTPKRVAPRRTEEKTSVVELDWFLPPHRWEAAPAALLGLIRRRCPEALPTRYGRYEPPPHRFDPGDPEPFTRFVLDRDEGDGFWFASRPSFGGGWTAPHADKYAAAEEERLRVGQLSVQFDGRVLEDDGRWREAVVELFVAAACELGAFFAAAQVEPNWTVSANNRLSASWDTMLEAGEHVLRGMLWQGLPPVPVWLSWFGGPYRALVAPHLTAESFAAARPSASPLKRLLKRGPEVEPRIESRAGGVFVRLGDEPRPGKQLGGWPLPADLTYRHRPVVKKPGGALGTDPPQPGDEADVIPDLGA